MLLRSSLVTENMIGSELEVIPGSSLMDLIAKATGAASNHSRIVSDEQDSWRAGQRGTQIRKAYPNQAAQIPCEDP